MVAVTFRCCKYLDHEKGNYSHCTLKNLRGLCVYWERGEVWTDRGNNLRDAQFCKLRGRLNSKTACIAGAGEECFKYEEEERTVEVD